jgi:F-type H+-transporting ATPase subunit epsilon
MADKILFELVSPEKLLLSKAVDMVTVPGTEGYMGVMAGHSPLVSTLRAGMINASKITVLAEEAIPMSEMDLAILDQRITDAQEDEIAAKTDADRTRAAQMVDDLKLVRAAF